MRHRASCWRGKQARRLRLNASQPSGKMWKHMTEGATGVVVCCPRGGASDLGTVDVAFTQAPRYAIQGHTAVEYGAWADGTD